MRALSGNRSSTYRAEQCGKAGARLRLLLLATCMLVAFVLSSGSALAAESHELLGSFGPDGTEASSFVEAEAVAVDEPAEIIYVLDRTGGGSLSKFDFEGNPVPFSGSAPYIVGNQITGLSVSGSPGYQQIAVDQVSHDIYVALSSSKVVAFEASGEEHLFTAGPSAGTNEIAPPGETHGVAVDRFGAIYVPSRLPNGQNELEIYGSSGEEIVREKHFTFYELVNLVLGTKNDLYATLPVGNVSKFLLSEVPVTAQTTLGQGAPFTPEGEFRAIGLAMNPVTGNIYIAEQNGSSQSSRIGVYDNAGKLVTSFAGSGQEGETEWAESVAVDGQSGKAFVADRFGGGTSQIRIFGPRVDRPTIEGFVSRVTGDSAVLGASINPNTLETSYHLEYGLEDCSVAACTSFPTVGIGAGYNPVAVGSQQVFGLQPGTTYHYRVVAQNSKGSSEANGTFTTQTAAFGFQLADSRAWEMVSPPQKFGARLFIRPEGPIQAAEDGNGLVFQSVGSIEEDPEGSDAPEASSVLSRRVGVDWQAKDLTVPRGEPILPSPIPEYSLFSPDLSRATVSPKDGFPLSPEASGSTPYLRTNAEPVTYTPMVTAKAAFANVPAGTELSQSKTPLVVGASRALDLVALESEVPLVADAEPFAVYGWRADDRQLRPISVLPAEEGEAVVAGMLGSGGGSVRNALSADGSRAFWSQGHFNPVQRPTALYVRDLETEESVRLDVPEPDAGGSGSPAPVFQAASADGSVAVFSDTRQLTKDASPEGRDLYRCSLPPQGEPLACELTNLTAPRANPGESAGVLGLVPGMSEDGTRLYFVATGVLDSEPNQAGDEAVPGEPNLYLWRQSKGVRYLATLSQADQSAWGAIGAAYENYLLSASTSPSGRYLTFMSARSLTGYNNHDDSSGQPVQEAYRYDAVADSLVCVSCNPTGARPDGEFRQTKRFSPVDTNSRWEKMWAAATLPTGRQSTNSGDENGVMSLSRPRAVLDNGRVFFNAVDGLVPADSNGNWDVYQYEPGGVGDCSASSGGPSTTYSAGGCVSLISSGTGEEEAGFIDASVSGNDVFLLTQERLAVTDVDGEYDVYDARVDGVPARLETSSQCQGEACQPAATAPNDPTPATATYQGPGDPKPKAKPRKRCAKHKQRASRKGKARCRRHNGRRAGR